MNAALLALLIAAASSVWIYTKLQNHTGYGNSKAAFKGALTAFVLGFIVVFTIAKLILK
jgi:uncharacterized membrane protein SpoIIM required for sporulation